MAAEKPSILVIFGDDIGWPNLSADHRGSLARDRMLTVDEESLGAPVSFIERSARAQKPFFGGREPARGPLRARRFSTPSRSSRRRRARR